MTSPKSVHLENVRGVRDELLQLIEGMDYCLDWKADADSWSPREVIYHLLDTPPGGLDSVVRGVLSGGLREYDLWADLSNMTPERAGHDMERVQEDIRRFFQNMEQALSPASDDNFQEKRVVVNNHTRGTHEERTLDQVLERAFSRHWREHLAQVQEVREALGV